jgi:hypothetical protein
MRRCQFQIPRRGSSCKCVIVPASKLEASEMAVERSVPKIDLDWSKLLGFDQVRCDAQQPNGVTLADPRLAKLGGKLGTKVGLKLAR